MANTHEGQIAYYKKRIKKEYITTVIAKVNGYENCTSVMDVGGGPVGVLFQLPKYKTRILVDPCNLLFFGGDVKNLTYIQEDFLTAHIQPCDVVLCLQVIEHIEDKKKFAEKLYQHTQKYLIVSIPYMWDVGDRIHDGLNETHINEWFPVLPTQTVLCPIKVTTTRRLICEWKI
jgi:hypothetical protein